MCQVDLGGLFCSDFSSCFLLSSLFSHFSCFFFFCFVNLQIHLHSHSLCYLFIYSCSIFVQMVWECVKVSFQFAVNVCPHACTFVWFCVCCCFKSFCFLERNKCWKMQFDFRCEKILLQKFAQKRQNKQRNLKVSYFCFSRSFFFFVH